ncbi:MAG: hypothetical protein IJ960_03125 [Oscillospiraceae bacterium]|nr:hypothetical protein [Oscillospiraceae bacterium]
MKNKLGSIFLSLAVAFGLWLYVVTTVSTEQERSFSNVQVVLEGESILRERNLMIISDTDFSVRVTLKGSRQDLNNLNSSNLTLISNLSGIYDPGEYQLGYSVGYPGNIPSGAVTVMNKEPSFVKVVVAEKISRNIPVRVEYVGNASDGFIVDKVNAVLEQEYVTITGPRETVEAIDHAYIEVDCTESTQTIIESYRFELRDKDSQPVDAAMITTNVEQVRVTVPVFMTKRIPLVMTVNPGGGATEETAKISIEPQYIDVVGSESALKDLEEWVLGTLNLADIGDTTERTYPIVLPQGVTEMNAISEALVNISFPDLAKREIVITNIQIHNVPEGMAAELLTKQFTITVRGPRSLVNQISAEDILVQIDLTGVENTAAVEAKISFRAEYAEVGVVGKYSVNVRVDEVVPDAEE